MNFLWLDVETTGLNEKKPDIIQLACLPIIDGVVQKSFNEFCQPINYKSIEQEALDIHGISVEQLRTFQSPGAMIEKFVQYVLSFDVKFTIAGYNVPFDKRFHRPNNQQLFQAGYLTDLSIVLHNSHKKSAEYRTIRRFFAQ